MSDMYYSCLLLLILQLNSVLAPIHITLPGHCLCRHDQVKMRVYRVTMSSELRADVMMSTGKFGHRNTDSIVPCQQRQDGSDMNLMKECQGLLVFT